MSELSELHGILGSNTLADWLKKNRHLSSENILKAKKMGEQHATEKQKKGRRKRYKTKEHLLLGELELDLATAKTKMQFYQNALNVINEIALELTGVDLLKKTGDELSSRSVNQKS